MIKRLVLLLAAVSLASAQNTTTVIGAGGGGATFTGVVASLPATCTEGAFSIVTDADALDDCSTGSSTLENVCICDDSNAWLDEDIGGSTGDTITVNGAAAADADFDDADPAAPANATNVTWQLNTATTPDSVSAYVNWALVESITRGGGGSASFTTTYSVSGTNTVVTHGNNVFNISTGLLQEGGNEVPNDTDHLGFFAATTSAQLAGVISNENGTGLFILQTSPTIITPTIASFANAAHDHSDAAGGAQISHDNALSGVSSDDHHAQLHAAAHTVGGGDLLTVDGVDAGAATTRTNENKIQITSHDTDCTALTDGVPREICLEEDSENFYTCQPTAGGCDTAAEWILTGGGTEINDLEADDPPNIEANEVYVGTGSGAGAWTAAPVLGTSVQASLIVSSQAVDGAAVGVEVRNTQAHAAASTNETADIDFYFATDLVGRIRLCKSDDYDPGPGEDDSCMSFWTDRGGTLTEGMRLLSTGGVLLDTGGAFGVGTGISFGDGDTEIFELNDDTLDIRLGASTKWRFSGSVLSNQAGGAQIHNDATNSAGSPAYSFTGDTDTGLFSVAAGNIGLMVDAELFFNVNGSGFTIKCQDTTATTGDTNCVARAGAGEAGNVWEAQDENSNVLTGIAGIATLGTETLDEVDFATHAEWDVTGDFLDSGGNCASTHSSGVGTCTQVEADLALTPAIANVRYAFTYTISGATGDAALTITTAFALTAVSLSAADGTFTTYFTSAAAPGNFVLDGTSTSGGITIDDVSLKQVRGGDITTQGPFQLLKSPNEPENCDEAAEGLTYYSTVDGKQCICANDGTDIEWMMSDDYAHATGHCTI